MPRCTVRQDGMLMSVADAPCRAPAAVLDTNAILDWLVFDNPGMAMLAAAVQAGTVRWLACSRMRDELAMTLGQPTLARRAVDVPAALAVFDRLACIAAAPATLPALRCSDPDDQVFIDLAVATRARWLVTHDRALLRLARRAGAHGVQIVRPAAWALLPA